MRASSSNSVTMGLHKTTEHESGYFEDEEDEEDISRRVTITLNHNREVVRDNSVDNLEEISCCERRDGFHRKSE